jgi:hypothetical protein
VYAKLVHFVAQTMGMGLMTVQQTCALGLRGDADTAPFANAKTLAHTARGHLHQVYEFRPLKWTKRNVRYMSGVRKYVRGEVARVEAAVTYEDAKGMDAASTFLRFMAMGKGS